MDRIQDQVEVHDTTISRPVTERSRITGARPAASPAYGGLGISSEYKSIDWQAVVASVVTGLAVTAMLVLLGAATGLISGNENTDAGEIGGIVGAVGAWTVVAMVLGTLVGSLLGGRLARWLDRGSIGYHALTSWGLATLLTIAMVCLATIAFSNAANATANTTSAVETTTDAPSDTAGTAGGTPAADGQANEGTTGTDEGSTSQEEAADNAADALGGAGLGIFLSMLLTLAASVAGWYIGSRKRLLDIEREPADSDARVAV